MPGITPDIVAAAGAANLEAYTQSFRTVYLVAIAFGVIGVIAALMTPNVEKLASLEDIPRKLHGKDIEKRAATMHVEKV